MTFLQTIAVAFSMFSAIPVPQFEWNKKNMRYAMCAFPLVGLVIGLCMYLWHLASVKYGLPAVLCGAGFCVIPVLITGGIHLDGFCDTEDALASHADFAKKQEILKDPHLGAFAAIRLGCYMVVTFALWSALPYFPPFAVILGFVLSRILSALAIASFPMAKDTGLAYTFAEAADKKRVRLILLILLADVASGLLLSGREGFFVLLAEGLAFALYYYTAERKFGGISGDLAGWFLQVAELWMLIALVIYEYIGVVNI